MSAGHATVRLPARRTRGNMVTISICQILPGGDHLSGDLIPGDPAMSDQPTFADLAKRERELAELAERKRKERKLSYEEAKKVRTVKEMAFSAGFYGFFGALAAVTLVVILAALATVCIAPVLP